MGTYYKFINPTMLQAVDPSNIGGGGCKYKDIIVGDAAHIFMWLHITDEHWQIISDASDSDTYYCKAYSDITKKVIREFNESYPDYKVMYRE